MVLNECVCRGLVVCVLLVVRLAQSCSMEGANDEHVFIFVSQQGGTYQWTS